MSSPISFDLPHRLGAEEAKRRIGGNMGKIASQLPAGADVQSSWEGDRLNLRVAAMGQEIAARIDVMEAIVRVEVALPPALSFFRPLIEAAMRRKGADLLEDRSAGA